MIGTYINFFDFWEYFGKNLGIVWELFGNFISIISSNFYFFYLIFGSILGKIWELFGNCLGTLKCGVYGGFPCWELLFFGKNLGIW
jgi:hypothetical protein